MPLTLHVDAAGWREHLRAVVASDPGLVPVVKGNGYGFGVGLLARTAAGLGVARVAAGTAAEAGVVLRWFGGEVIVLDPETADPARLADPGRRVVWTAGSVTAAAALAASRRRLIVDCATSLGRQGITVADLPALSAVTGGGRAVEAFSVHLPIDRPKGADPAGQAARWVRALTNAGFTVGTLYVSHLEPGELAALAAAFPATSVAQRTGTRLWLGRRTALHPAATVTHLTPIARGDRFGYRQYRARRPGWLVTVAGGTAHGIGLSTTPARHGPRPAAATLARASLAAAGRAASPYTWHDQRLRFAEPPHMLASMLWLPATTPPPQPGTELPARLRYTTTRFDAVTLYPAEQDYSTRPMPRWTPGTLTVLGADELSANAEVAAETSCA